MNLEGAKIFGLAQSCIFQKHETQLGFRKLLGRVDLVTSRVLTTFTNIVRSYVESKPNGDYYNESWTYTGKHLWIHPRNGWNFIFAKWTANVKIRSNLTLTNGVFKCQKNVPSNLCNRSHMHTSIPIIYITLTLLLPIIKHDRKFLRNFCTKQLYFILSDNHVPCIC